MAATPCSIGGSSEGNVRAKPHDLARMESSGYLKRLGYEVPEARYDRIFREPDSVLKALRASGSG